MMRAGWIVAASLGLAAGCGGKEPEAALDYGAEDAIESKADSVTRPATLVSIVLDRVARASLSATERYRGFVFTGRAGQRFDLFADGLGGLDTVLYIYKVSARTGRAYGGALVSNDDTSKATWTLLSNARPNPDSSSVSRFALPADGAYALVVTSYRQRGVGDVEVRVRPSSSRCDASGTARRFSFPSGITEEGEVGLEVGSVMEGERYADAQGRHVKWIAKDGEDAKVQRWVWGVNDLWAVRFTVDRATCATTVTGEH